MDTFKPIGEVAKDVLNNITRKRMAQLTNRHIAMCLSELDYLNANEKEVIKKNFHFFEVMMLEQIFGIKGEKDERNER